jgi:hypothetical protein
VNRIVIIVEIPKILTLSLIFPSPARTEKLNPVRILKIRKIQVKERSCPESSYFSPKSAIAISGPSVINSTEILQIKTEK